MLAGEVTVHDGVRLTTAPRTLVDLALHLTPNQSARAFREALRLGATTAAEIAATVSRHRGRRGTRVLADLCVRYADIPYARTRSNAEARALEVLADAGEPLPHVNLAVGGEEADLVYPARRQIIEIDGDQFHRFPDEDRRKEERWRKAGYTVQRVPSEAVYSDPDALLRLARG